MVGRNAPQRPLHSLTIYGGKLELYSDYVLHRRIGMLADTFGMADRVFRLDRIASVEIEEGSNPMTRYLRLRLKDQPDRPAETFIYRASEDKAAWDIKSVIDQTIADKDILRLIPHLAG